MVIVKNFKPLEIRAPRLVNVLEDTVVTHFCLKGVKKVFYRPCFTPICGHESGLSLRP